MEENDKDKEAEAKAKRAKKIAARQLRALAETEQRLTFLADIMPYFIARHFSNCCEAGLSEAEGIFWTEKVLIELLRQG